MKNIAIILLTTFVSIATYANPCKVATYGNNWGVYGVDQEVSDYAKTHGIDFIEWKNDSPIIIQGYDYQVLSYFGNSDYYPELNLTRSEVVISVRDQKNNEVYRKELVVSIKPTVSNLGRARITREVKKAFRHISNKLVCNT